MSSRRVVLYCAYVAGVTITFLLVTAEMAAAHNCQNFTDCFASADAATDSLLGMTFLGMLSMGLDFVPYVGTAKGVVEAVTGRDLLTGEELSDAERLLGLVPGGLGHAGDVLSSTRHLDEMASVAGGGLRHGDELADAARHADDVPTRPLTDADHGALRDYSGSGYRDMNNSQRWPDRYTDAERTALQERADAVSEALAKLPPEPGRTYRGVDLPDEAITRYEPGQIVTEPSFTSTSRDITVAHGEFEGNTLFVVNGQNGRDIAPFSQFPGEAEVLYDKGTDFYVQAREWNPDLDKWVIYLREAS